MQNPLERGILYLSRKDVERACQQLDSVEIMRNVFQLHGSGQTVLPDEAYLTWSNTHGEQVRSLNMPAYIDGTIHMAGTKIINGNIHNPARGLPRASGLTLLYDDTSVQVLCAMEGAYISSLRTASVSLLAIEHAKGPSIACAALIGAGVLAQAHLELLLKRLSELRVIQIFDLSQQRVQDLQGQLAGRLQEKDVVLHVARSAEEAIRAAQLIITATTTTTGYIQYNWLQPGAILVNVSLDDPLPEVVLCADGIIVDDWGLIKSDTRRLLGRMYRQGLLVGPEERTTSAEQRQIDAELGEIICGTKRGRSHEQDIILINPFGLAIEDIALATRVYHQALQSDSGVWLER